MCRTPAIVLAVACFTAPASAQGLRPTEADVLNGARRFFQLSADGDGSFRPGTSRDYEGMSDSAYSDLAPTAYAVVLHRTFGWPLPNEAKTRAFLSGRQRPDGAFVNVRGTVDPKSAAGRAYNTTMAVMALRALGTKPTHNPLPVYADVLVADYKSLPAYMTSFFPLAYLASGQDIPDEADRKIRAMMDQADDGYLHEHIAATFHAAHYYRLTNRPTPKADAMLKRVLADQRPDGSWVLNHPARDRHATFDAVFVLHQLGGEREDCQRAIAKAAEWALGCRNPDGGFGHVPGSTSDADACYFHLGTLVMAGRLKSADLGPADPRVLGWGHVMPVRPAGSSRDSNTPRPGANSR